MAEVLERLERRQSFQTIAWFRDLYRRQLLELDPPYQRKSVWNQRFRDFFIETVLLQYPAPAIFLHEEINTSGDARYNVVDGKQRLTTIFDFTEDLFPVSEDSALGRFQGLFFSQLDDDTKKAFWTYQFSVEYLPSVEEGTLTNVFDRINRNVARLTRQELRHARFDGRFARSAEDLNEMMLLRLPPDMPRIAHSSRQQMKDVELVAQLLLLVEGGPKSFSQDDLDEAYASRDFEWDLQVEVEDTFRRVIDYLVEVFEICDLAQPAMRRIRNQADFYSLFGAVLALWHETALPPPADAAQRLEKFLALVADESSWETHPEVKKYYEAARSASNDLGQRTSRIDLVRDILLGISPS